MADRRRTHDAAFALRRPTQSTHDHTDHERSTVVHTLHGTVALAIHADRVREHSHPSRRTWMEAARTGRARPHLRARLGRGPTTEWRPSS